MKLLKEQEVSERLTISLTSLRRWRMAGTGPEWVKLGKSVRYPESSLVKYIDSVTHSPLKNKGEQESEEVDQEQEARNKIKEFDYYI